MNSFKVSTGINVNCEFKTEYRIGIAITITTEITHLKEFTPKNKIVEANKHIQADLELVRIMQIMIKTRKIKDIVLLKKESFFTNFAKAIGKMIFNHAPA